MKSFMRLPIFFIAAALLLSACSGAPALSPEQSAVQSVQRFGPTSNIQPDMNTVEVRQSVPLGSSRLTLVTFQGQRLEPGGQKEDCVFVYIARRQLLSWQDSGGGGSCSPAGVNTDPIGVGAGFNSAGNGMNEISHVDGLVFQPEIATVVVEWEDGEIQQVPVMNNSYLAARSGDHQMVAVRALDESGAVVFTHTVPTPAPGKE